MYDESWDEEVKRANQGKVGAPFKYSDTFIRLAAALRAGAQIKYRQLQGMLVEMIGRVNTPAYSQLYKRINKLKVNINESNGMITVQDEENHRLLVMAMDSSGIKQHNRGEWMRIKWGKKVWLCKAAHTGGYCHQEDTCSRGHRRHRRGFIHVREAARADSG